MGLRHAKIAIQACLVLSDRGAGCDCFLIIWSCGLEHCYVGRHMVFDDPQWCFIDISVDFVWVLQCTHFSYPFASKKITSWTSLSHARPHHKKMQLSVSHLHSCTTTAILVQQIKCVLICKPREISCLLLSKAISWFAYFRKKSATCTLETMSQLSPGFSLDTSSPFHKHGLTLIPAWISNHMLGKVWDEITYPFLNFNGCTVEV